MAGVLVGALILGWLGIPVVSSQGIFIRSYFVTDDFPLIPESSAWDKVPMIVIPLSGQLVTRPVWPDPSVPSLRVRSIHNGSEIAFFLEWQDNTKNDILSAGTFRDGVALGFPIGEAPAFFCMGQLDHYINIWHWKADWETDIERRKKERDRRDRFEPIPRRVSSVEDLIGGGFSTLTTKDTQGRVQGKARWKDGFWRVVMTRSLKLAEPGNEARLDPGRIQVVSFAVWNGENKERNGQKAVSPWFQLLIDPITTL
ncbi:MAG TPA: ethylbenzene dehydrogenase-related protein [Nitrospira sp.]|nr:ethylbenzene dehydrogenase-related protein [Nitrospira sp.]